MYVQHYSVHKCRQWVNFKRRSSLYISTQRRLVFLQLQKKISGHTKRKLHKKKSGTLASPGPHTARVSSERCSHFSDILNRKRCGGTPCQRDSRRRARRVVNRTQCSKASSGSSKAGDAILAAQRRQIAPRCSHCVATPGLPRTSQGFVGRNTLFVTT
ncbi:unnamed protein product [Ixodes persulcatus]